MVRGARRLKSQVRRTWELCKGSNFNTGIEWGGHEDDSDNAVQKAKMFILGYHWWDSFFDIIQLVHTGRPSIMLKGSTTTNPKTFFKAGSFIFNFKMMKVALPRIWILPYTFCWLLKPHDHCARWLKSSYHELSWSSCVMNVSLE